MAGRTSDSHPDRKETLLHGAKYYAPCTEFARAVTVGMPKHMGLTLADKLRTGAKYGFKPSASWKPKVGQVLIADYGSPYGHTEVVNSIMGDSIRISESNFDRHLEVTHNRTMKKTDPHIKYVLDTKVKDHTGG